MHSQMLCDKVASLSHSPQVPLLSHTFANWKDIISRSSHSNPLTTQADPSSLPTEVLRLRLQEVKLATTDCHPMLIKRLAKHLGSTRDITAGDGAARDSTQLLPLRPTASGMTTRMKKGAHQQLLTRRTYNIN